MGGGILAGGMRCGPGQIGAQLAGGQFAAGGVFEQDGEIGAHAAPAFRDVFQVAKARPGLPGDGGDGGFGIRGKEGLQVHIDNLPNGRNLV